MLYKAKALKNFKLNSLDGEIGKVKELYFDDRYWTIRYLVVDTGNWLMDREVLISPYALTTVNEEEKYINVNLTQKKIEESPSLDYDKPVSREFEGTYHNYYGWPVYWGGTYMWGAYPHIERSNEQLSRSNHPKKSQDHHLRSTHDVSGYTIQATDGEIGHVEDFIIDDVNWAIRYLIIDTKILWLGKKVLVSPLWINRVSWSEGKVFVNHSIETIKQSPEYTDELLLSRDYETGLHEHYQQKGYWMDEATTNENRNEFKK